MASGQMELRGVDAHEWELAANIIGLALSPSGRDISPADKSELSLLPQSFRKNGGEFWVLAIKGTLVGCVGIKPSGQAPRLWELKYFSLVPAWRRMGLGRMMAEKAISHARENGAEAITAALHTGCAAAVALLSSLKFAALGVDPHTHEGAFQMRRDF